jgi:GNAT superfamily N-acetyltransferase
VAPPLPLGPADLLEEVVVAPRRAYVPVPDLRVIERPGWLQLVTPSFRRGGLNGVLVAVLDPDTADAVIDATIAEYRALGIRFRWTVDHQSAPPDLGARLAQRGLMPREVVGMARATRDPPVADPLVTIERVDRALEPIYTAVMAAGWSVDPAPLRTAHLVALDDPAQTSRLYLARLRGEPAGVAASVVFERSVYLLGAVVLPAFRRAGVYRALVGARLADAAEAGRTVATSQARAETSAPLLARMGFSEITRFINYEAVDEP